MHLLVRLSVLSLVTVLGAFGGVLPVTGERDKSGSEGMELERRQNGGLPQANFSVNDANQNGLMSVNFYHDPATAKVWIAVQCVNAQWCALGVGSNGMSDASVWIGWNNGAGSTTLSQRASAGEFLPPYADRQDAVLGNLPAAITVPPLTGATLLFDFSIPDSYFNFNGQGTNMIFAMSQNGGGPDDPANPQSSFGMHDITPWSQTISLAAGSVAGMPAPNSAAPSAAAPAAVPSKTASSSASQSSTPSGAATGSGAGTCNAANTFCFTSSLNPSTSMVTITLQATGAGWVAIGVGCTTMSCPNMYIGWTSGGDTVLSQRSASGHTSPSPNGNTDGTVVATPASVKTAIAKPGVSVSFQIPYSKISTTSNVNLIWAFGNTAPGVSPTSSIGQHGSGNYGTMVVNLATGQGSAVADNTNNLKLIHGCLMFLAWGVLPFATIFIARYLKSKLGHWWYILHMCIGLAILVLTVVAIIVIEMAVPGPLSQRFNSSLHAYMGAAIGLGLLPLQVILGYVSNHLFSPDRPKVPWWDQLHWWTGRIVIVLTWLEMFWGLQLYGSGVVVIALYFIALLAGVGVNVAGHFMFGGAVHHVKGAPGFDSIEAGENMERKGTNEGRSKLKQGPGSAAGTLRSDKPTFDRKQSPFVNSPDPAMTRTNSKDSYGSAGRRGNEDMKNGSGPRRGGPGSDFGSGPRRGPDSPRVPPPASPLSAVSNSPRGNGAPMKGGPNRGNDRNGPRDDRDRQRGPPRDEMRNGPGEKRGQFPEKRSNSPSSSRSGSPRDDRRGPNTLRGDDDRRGPQSPLSKEQERRKNGPPPSRGSDDRDKKGPNSPRDGQQQRKNDDRRDASRSREEPRRGDSSREGGRGQQQRSQSQQRDQQRDRSRGPVNRDQQRRRDDDVPEPRQQRSGYANERRGGGRQ